MTGRSKIGLAAFVGCIGVTAGLLVVAQRPARNNDPDILITATPTDQTVYAGDEATVTFTQRLFFQNPPVNGESTAKADKVRQTSVVKFGDNTSACRIVRLMVNGIQFDRDGTKQGVTVKFALDRHTATITKTNFKVLANTALIHSVGATGTFPTLGQFVVSMHTSVLVTLNGQPESLTGEGHAMVRTSGLWIVSAAPNPLILGKDLLVTYRVIPGVKFESLQLDITNKAGTLVFKADGLPFTAGNHITFWPAGKWNQPPHNGSLANPANGPYALQLKGTHISASGKKEKSASNVVEVNTLLVLETGLDDDKPTPHEISSGLYRPCLDMASPERLWVGLMAVNGGAITFAPDLPVISHIVQADLDNDPTNGLEVKSDHVLQVMQLPFANGRYKVVLKNVRDLAGNQGVQGSNAGVVEDWIISLY